MDKKNFSVYPSDRSIEKRWKVFWYEHDLLSGTKVRRQAYGDINRFTTADQRMLAAERLIDQLCTNQRPEKKAIDFTPLENHLQQIISLRACNLVPKSEKMYRFIANDFMNWLRIHKTMDAAYYIKYLKDQGKSATTINFYRCTFRTIFKDLLQRGSILENPFLNIPKLKERRNHGRFFDETEIPLIRDKIVSRDPGLWMVCQYIFYMFVRPSELFQIKLDQVSLSRKVITVLSGGSKVGTQRNLIIPDALLSLFETIQLQSSPKDLYLVGKENGLPGKYPADKNRFYRPHQKVMKDLGYGQGYYLYSWKHTGNYIASSLGVPSKEIQIHNGHTSLKTTDNYLHHIAAENWKALPRLMPII
jgi:integrase